MVLNEAVEVPSWMSTSFGQDLGCSLSYVDRPPSNRIKKIKKVGGLVGGTKEWVGWWSGWVGGVGGWGAGMVAAVGCNF